MRTWVVAVLISFGCGAGSQVPHLEEMRSSLSRNLSPDVSATEMGSAVSGDTDFALNLYKVIRGEDRENLFFSPHSISIALAMTYAGAQGETAKQMADALSFKLPSPALHSAFNALDLALSSRAQGHKGINGQSFKLNIVNAIWGQKGRSVVPAFLDTLALNYGAGFNVLDFVGDAEGARSTINTWVEGQTNDKIKELLPKDSVTDLTRLVLTNAVYFNAAWETPFQLTNDSGSFVRLDGTRISTPTMSNQASYPLVNTSDYSAVELPYDGKELSLVIVMPSDFAAFEASLDGAKIGSIVAGLTAQQVLLTVPKVEFTASLSLKDSLDKLGMHDAFKDDADFSGIDGMRDLYISDVIHKGYVAINEKGTEAAAATGVVVATDSALSNIHILSIDHPYLFFIRDVSTNAIVFLGRVMDPGTK